MKTHHQLTYMMMKLAGDSGASQNTECTGAWDIYKRYLPKIDTKQLAMMILEKIPEEKRKTLLRNAGQELEISKNLFDTPLKEFKRHNINYTILIKNIVSILEKEED